MDIFKKCIYDYLKLHSGEVFLKTEFVKSEVKMSPQTLAKKLKDLEAEGYITHVGKRFYVIK